MKKFQFVLFAVLAVCAFVRAEDVLDLDGDNFDTIVNQNELMLVEFYAPWCGHCKRLAPDYEKAATELKEVNIPLAKVNADEEKNKPLASRFGIRGFPTLKVFRKGVPQDYTGERSVASIVKYMKRQARPAIETLNTVEEVTTFADSERIVIVGFFESKDASYEQFKAIAEPLRNSYVFAEVIGKPEVAKHFGVQSLPDVVLFKKFDEGKNLLGSANFETLSNFITANSMPIIDEVGPENYKAYADTQLPLAYVFVDPNVEGQKDTYVARIYELAKEKKGKVNFVWIDFNKHAKHGQSLGLSGKVVPAFAMEEIGEGRHYAYDETKDVTTEGVTEMINQFLEGKLPPTIKSEEIPATNDEPVKIIVGKTYDQIVNDNTKDVFVEFYAPWCGHCKKLVPVYDQLATALKDVPSVVIAKIDATANDLDPKLGIKGFPTLKLFKAGSKDTPVEYQGDRSYADMLKFLTENTSAKIEVGKDEL